MERTAELQAANEDLEAFSYSAAHDLRAPLRAIGGFVNLLESEFANTLSHAGLEYLTVISKSTERMGKLIDDLLAF
ncbi:MAG TPA: histidine kinase dimerization/phospho-acceptor domain-containing protein, partial [Candidatus Acidoferrum sp.]|nr:histidine kinase dimerization/phospho-acceptor domain-containing protein [Candidatus Acidoferrum sp.]